MKAFLFGLFGLITIATLQFRPQVGGVWLVQMMPTLSHNTAVSNLLGQQVRLVEIIGDHTFIVKAESGVKARDLFAVGAFAVVNATASYGCTPPKPTPVWAKSG